MPLEEQIGRHMEECGELLSLGLADGPLSTYNFRGYASRAEHARQVPLAQAVLFHRAAQPAVGSCPPSV